MYKQQYSHNAPYYNTDFKKPCKTTFRRGGLFTMQAVAGQTDGRLH